MIAIATHSTAQSAETSSQRTADLHGKFLKLLPDIRRQARFCFRHLRAEDREDVMQEVVAHALQAFVQMWRQGREQLAFAVPLALFAVARVRDGRRLGTRRNMRDITSSGCQRRHGVQIEILNQPAYHDGDWRAIVVEDRRAGPAEIAAARLDVAAWLGLLPRRHRVLAMVLASGETTTAAAKLFHISAGRVSQMRRELYELWCRFQGENPMAPL